MATTTTHSTKIDPPIPQFAEHDKLGPFGGKASVIEDEALLRRSLVAEFLAAAEAARDASGKVDQGAAAAVHDYRKALRRARAVLELVGGALPKSERRAVRRALQDARRALGASRDHAVAPEALSTLPLGEPERDTAKLVAAAATAAMPPTAEIKQLLAEGAARALAQVEALEAALPPSVDWSTVVSGVRGVYDAARCARKAAKRSRRSFHTWRRRSKELTYQLDILSGYAGANTTTIASEISGVTDTQGPAVDLIMLRDFVRTYGDGISPEALEHLTVAIDAELDGLMKDVRTAGREAFRRKPRQFAKKLAKAVRRDQAPRAEPSQRD